MEGGTMTRERGEAGSLDARAGANLEARPDVCLEASPDASLDMSTRLEHEAALESLEAEIAEIWGHISAATYRFLNLVAELDRREGWGRHGVASCAQWLNLKCGIGIVAAREKVRVARALESLPAIAQAFRDGQISYSKVRAVTRAATPATEKTLLSVALHGTATHVERLVRKYRGAERAEDAAAAERQHLERFLSFTSEDDGRLTVFGRLPAEVGAIVVKAIEAAVETLEDASACMDSSSFASTLRWRKERLLTCIRSLCRALGHGTLMGYPRAGSLTEARALALRRKRVLPAPVRPVRHRSE